MAAKPLPLGAWEEDRSLLHSAVIGDRGDVSDLPPETQFQVYVARLVNRREQNSAAEYDMAAAFVLVSAEAYANARAGRAEERLIHTGARRLTGRIHFVTAGATSSIVEEYGSDDNALFKRLAAIGVSTRPTLVYVPQKPNSSLSYYPKGTATDVGLTDVPLKIPDVSAEAIQHAIDEVHRQELVTPDNTGPYKLWVDAAKGRPFDEAEKGVQQFLKIGLATKFGPRCSIRQEQPAKVGRTDLEIVDDRTGAPGHSIHHAVLELKVLRSRGSTGAALAAPAMQTHIKEGVEQAHAYGNDKNTKLKMLCCFDMRDSNDGDQTTFSHVSAVATTLNVLLRRWFLYRDSATYRAALAAQHVAAAAKSS